MSTPSTQTIALDGKTLEGGGQLLRLALSLSCLTGRAIHVTSIRGNRPGRRGQGRSGGGMKGSHYECARWLALAANAHTEGMEVGSPSLLFAPGLDGFTSIDAVLGHSANASSVFGLSSGSDATGNPRPRYLTITQKTPGAVYLVLQALLPYVLFGPFGQPRAGETSVPPVHLRIIGGTNASKAPSHEYATQVLLPTLVEHVGIPPIKTTLVRRGWASSGGSSGRDALGEVLFEIQPLKAGETIPGFQMTRDDLEESGKRKLVGLELSVLAHPKELLDEIEEEVTAELGHRFPEKPVATVLKEDSKRRARVYVLVVAKVSTEGREVGHEPRIYRLGKDTLYEGKANASKELGRSLAKMLVRGLRDEIASGGLVDEHLQDQLVVFQALAEGRSQVSRGTVEPSLHTLTARWVAEQMLQGITFAADGSCQGVAFASGTQAVTPGTTNELESKDDNSVES